MAKAKEWLPREPVKLDPEQARLLVNVLEHPDDDGARLVYADWLMGRGDPRGEFISASIQLTTLDSQDPRWSRMYAREKELARQHEGRWLAEIGWPEQGQVPRFVRGFLRHVDGTAQTLVPLMDSLLAREPVRSLRVRSIKPAELLDDLLACPHLKRLQQIEFCGGEGFSATQARKIASAENLAGIEHLSLFTSPLGAKGAKAVADALALPALKQLSLALTRLGDEGAEALAAAKRLPDAIDLQSNDIGPRGAVALAKSPALAGVRALVLTRNQIRDIGIAALATSPYAEGLRELRLDSTGIGSEGAEALARSDLGKTLEILDLRTCALGSRGVAAIGAMKGLKALDLDGSADPEVVAKAQAGRPKPGIAGGHGFLMR